jgi:hypothetical protein
MDAMRENTEVSVYMFEGKGHEGMTMYTTGHRLQKCKYKSPRKLYNIWWVRILLHQETNVKLVFSLLVQGLSVEIWLYNVIYEYVS